MKGLFVALGTFALFVLSSCSNLKEHNIYTSEPGVSKELAEFRKTHFLEVKYDLSFRIPESKEEPVVGVAKLRWIQDKPEPLMIDFRADSSRIESVVVNESPIKFGVVNEHIVSLGNKSITHAGTNEAVITFKANDQSLNRRDEFLYTLLVPDRARTLFPCFDQPDIKAKYSLSLDIPISWNAVSNSAVSSLDTLSRPGRKLLSFGETEPLSTYLFSFVAGKLKYETFTRGNRSISLYHRENNPEKVSQTPVIASQVFDALEWMENYTGINYPFSKYDLIVLPGFQYGGMEHTGATLYADRTIFLNENPTLNEELARSSLIAHETAHMWFGDFVTMAWFDDVWTKEVFANYFASKMVQSMFPTVNHRLNFIQDYFPPSYSEDRTAGAMPIQQPLDNLSNAGLIYSNIIYNKSPIVMEKLVQLLGDDAFRKGIQEYLNTYAYGNATWDNLISILDKYTDSDLEQWSLIWVKENCMPTIQARCVDSQLVVRQSDPQGKGRLWPQNLKYIVKNGDKEAELNVCMTSDISEIIVDLPFEAGEKSVVIPNADGIGYGYFLIDNSEADALFNVLDTASSEVLKGSVLITLFENVINKSISSENYIKSMLSYIPKEKNKLLYTMALGYMSQAQTLFPVNSEIVEKALIGEITNQQDKSLRLQAFRKYVSLSGSKNANTYIYNVWKNQKAPRGCSLSENDYVNMAYELSVRMPDEYENIMKTQTARFSNADRLQEFEFISPAVSPLESVRDSAFNSLLKAENRRVEPWASSALRYLNHPLRQNEAVKYIRPALDILPEVQKTGDIFFPTAWLRALLSGHHSAAAKSEVDAFLKENPDMNYLLISKLKQQADHLYR